MIWCSHRLAGVYGLTATEKLPYSNDVFVFVLTHDFRHGLLYQKPPRSLDLQHHSVTAAAAIYCIYGTLSGQQRFFLQWLK